MSRKGLKLSNLYFVLYLLAIVLLLPDKREKQGESNIMLIESLLAAEFEVAATPGLLSARVVQTSDSAFFAEINNTATIAFSNTIAQPEFSYRIASIRNEENAVLAGPLDNDGTLTPEIRLTRNNDSELLLHWQPEVDSYVDQLLQVTVVVEGKPIVPSRLADSPAADRIRQFIQDGLRVRDSVIVLLNYSVDAITSARLAAGTSTVDTVYSSSVDTIVMQSDQQFAVTSYTPYLQVLDGQTWENTLTFSQPISQEFSIAIEPNSDQTRFSRIANNQLLVQGVASGESTGQVSVTVTDTEGLRTVVRFTVQSTSVQEPTIPTFLFPDIQYTIDPGFPSQVAGLSIETRCLIAGDVIYSNNSGSPFEIAVDDRRVGMSMLVQRFVDGKAYGRVYSVPIRAYPLPEVVSVQRTNDDIVIKTRSYGVYNQLPNRIRVSGTGAVVQELTGSIEFDNSNHAIIQTFVISQAQSGTALRIQDARGGAIDYTIE